MGEKAEFTNYFREIHVKFSRIHVQLLSEADTTLPQYALLSQLVSCGTVAMSEAGKRIHLSKPAITNLVDRLEQKKLLKRLPHPKDRRISLLEVQPKGEKLVHQIQGKVLGFILKTLEEFSGHDKQVIIQFYSALLKNAGTMLDNGKKS